MGSVTSRRIIEPQIGAKLLTLNYTESQPPAEFAQHVHDRSDDNIILLQGQADLRQGATRTPFHAGQCAFVPAGQIHGTITTASDTVMISFQVPPDLALYTGARDSSRPGAAPPKGKITPGAVKFVDFAQHNGIFLGPEMGATRATAAHRRLHPGEAFPMSLARGTEGLIFVWKGAILSVVGRSAEGRRVLAANEKDTIFLSGPVRLTVSNPGPAQAIVFQVQTVPPRQ